MGGKELCLTADEERGYREGANGRVPAGQFTECAVNTECSCCLGEREEGGVKVYGGSDSDDRG